MPAPVGAALMRRSLAGFFMVNAMYHALMIYLIASELLILWFLR